jgi:hypothetical protein
MFLVITSLAAPWRARIIYRLDLRSMPNPRIREKTTSTFTLAGIENSSVALNPTHLSPITSRRSYSKTQSRGRRGQIAVRTSNGRTCTPALSYPGAYWAASVSRRTTSEPSMMRMRWEWESYIRFWYHNLYRMCSLIPHLAKHESVVPQLVLREQIGIKSL